MRESARTEPKILRPSRQPTPRKSLGAAKASGGMEFLKLAQCTNLSREEQMRGGCGANAGRIRRNANVTAVR